MNENTPREFAANDEQQNSAHVNSAQQTERPQYTAASARTGQVNETQPIPAQPATTQSLPTQPVPTPPQPAPHNYAVPTAGFAQNTAQNQNGQNLNGHNQNAQSQSGQSQSGQGQYNQQYAYGPQTPAVAGNQGAQRQRMVLPMVATAAVAAILASVGTAAATGQFTHNNSAQASQSAPKSSANVGTKTDSSVSVPVASSTNENPDWQKVSAAVAPSVVAIHVTTAQGEAEGSGVIIDGSGHIVTNNHVVEGAQNNKVTVILNDGRMYTAKITGLDAATDLAVIQLENPPQDLTSAVFTDSNTVTVGSAVMAMGNPLGLSQTATTGIVSAIDRPVSTAETSDGTLVVSNAIQIDAAVNPGNSGGPLFNAQGEIIGITSSIATMQQSSAFSSAQSGSIGLGFAIPSNLVKNIAGQLIDSGSAQHAFLGVSLTDGTGTADGATRQGAQVVQVTADSPAAKAGLKNNDVIVSIDGKSVTGYESLTGFVREHNAGDTVTLQVIRDGKLISVDATLAQKTEDATSNTQGNGSQGNGSQDGQGNQNRQGNQGNQGGQGNGSQDQTNPNNLPNLGDLFPNLPGFSGRG